MNKFSPRLAKKLYGMAQAKEAAKQDVQEGSYNKVIRVEDVVVRIHKEEDIAGDPLPWRAYPEAEVLDLLDGMHGRTPQLLYADPNGRYMIQKWENAQTLRDGKKALGSLPRDYVDRVADFWRDLQHVPPPTGDRSLPAGMSRNLYVHDPNGPDVDWVPRTLSEYVSLHTRAVAAIFDTGVTRDDYIVRKIGIPSDPERYSETALGKLTEVPLALAHPDLHGDNLAMKAKSVQEPFFFDVEHVSPQDPRHALATMIFWAECEARWWPERVAESRMAAVREGIIDAHERVAPQPLKRDFRQAVDAWLKHVAIARISFTQIGWNNFVESNYQLGENSFEEKLQERVKFMMPGIETALPLLGQVPPDERYVAETLRRAVHRRRALDSYGRAMGATPASLAVAARGFGVLAGSRVAATAVDQDGTHDRSTIDRNVPGHSRVDSSLSRARSKSP